MSKSQLRKELATFTGEQLVEVVLDAYNSSPAAKKYFEYFLNPDPKRLREEEEEVIAKELSRSKWGTCKARVSIIKNAIKEFIAFKGDSANHVLLLRNAFIMMVGNNRDYDYPDPLYNGTAFMAVEFVRTEAEESGIDEAIRQFEHIVDRLARPRMAVIVRNAVKDYCNSINTIRPLK